MKFAKSILMGTGSLVLAGLLLTLLVPKAAHAIAATLVQVANTSANPIPNRDQDNPAQQPFQWLTQPAARNGQTRAETDFTVPIGKRLVLEYISAEIPEGSGNVTVETTVGGNLAAWYFIQGSSTRGFFPTRIYADPGTSVQVIVQGSNTQADVELSGHFVNIP